MEVCRRPNCNNSLTSENYNFHPYCSQDCKNLVYYETETLKLHKKLQEIDTDKVNILQTNYNKSLFVFGKVGTGKTIFAGSIAKKLFREGGMVKWIDFAKFVSMLRSAVKNPNEDVHNLAMNIAKFSGTLIIDDLGNEIITDFLRNTVYVILNERELEMLPTVITSNHTLDELDEIISNKISSRIAGMCEVLEFTGKDRRLK